MSLPVRVLPFSAAFVLLAGSATAQPAPGERADCDRLPAVVEAQKMLADAERTLALRRQWLNRALLMDEPKLAKESAEASAALERLHRQRAADYNAGRLDMMRDLQYQGDILEHQRRANLLLEARTKRLAGLPVDPARNAYTDEINSRTALVDSARDHVRKIRAMVCGVPAPPPEPWTELEPAFNWEGRWSDGTTVYTLTLAGDVLRVAGGSARDGGMGMEWGDCNPRGRTVRCNVKGRWESTAWIADYEGVVDARIDGDVISGQITFTKWVFTEKKKGERLPIDPNEPQPITLNRVKP